VRIGLEDNLYYDNERKVKATNLSLLKRIHELAAVLERPMMTPAEFGGMGFYNQFRTTAQ
jgi:uncharacterized protein (DUF849 family)